MKKLLFLVVLSTLLISCTQVQTNENSSIENQEEIIDSTNNNETENTESQLANTMDDIKEENQWMTEEIVRLNEEKEKLETQIRYYKDKRDECLTTSHVTDLGDGFKEYRNKEKSITFRLPTELELTEELYKEEDWYIGSNRAPSMADWYRITVGNTLLFEINPGGYGPFFSDKEYTVERLDDGTVKIVSEEDMPKDECNQDDSFVVLVNGFEHNGNTYDWMLTIPLSEKNNESMYRTIIESFVIN